MTEPLPPLNVPLFQKVADKIRETPHLLNMHSFVNPYSDCGTTRCIAGWACYLTEPNPSTYPHESRARIALGLTTPEANLLFYASEFNGSPTDRRQPYFDEINRLAPTILPAMLMWMVEQRNFSWADAFKHFGIPNLNAIQNESGLYDSEDPDGN